MKARAFNRLHAIAVMATLVAGLLAVTFWSMAELRPAGLCAVVSMAALLVWQYIEQQERGR